jgi:hypothetical protein
MDVGGDRWWFHPGALESVIHREVAASSGGSPVVSRGSPHPLPGPATATAGAGAGARAAAGGATASSSPGRARPSSSTIGATGSKAAPPLPTTILANGLIELEALNRRKDLFVYGKPSFAPASPVLGRLAAGACVRVVDLR